MCFMFSQAASCPRPPAKMKRKNLGTSLVSSQLGMRVSKNAFGSVEIGVLSLWRCFIALQLTNSSLLNQLHYRLSLYWKPLIILTWIHGLVLFILLMTTVEVSLGPVSWWLQYWEISHLNRHGVPVLQVFMTLWKFFWESCESNLVPACCHTLKSLHL